MSKIIAPVPKDVVVDSRRNIIGTGLVVFFGEQGDDPIETAEDIYAKVDGIETSIGKFVEIKENGQFYYNDNPVSIFIKGSLNKYVSCGLYQKIGNKLSQIDYIGSSPGFTASQMLGEQIVQNIRSKAGYKRHFVSMSEAQSYQDYKLNQVVFISEVNNDPKLSGQFIIKFSESNIVDNITNFKTSIERYVLQRITGAYPYKNTLQVTAKSIDEIHKFMYHLKLAGNFKCTIVVDYNFTTENLDLTIFKKVIFNKFVPILKGISAREVVFRDGGFGKTNIFKTDVKSILSLIVNNYDENVRWVIENCIIDDLSIEKYIGLYVLRSKIKSFSGTKCPPDKASRKKSRYYDIKKYEAEMQRNIEIYRESSIGLVISNSSVNVNNSIIDFDFFAGFYNPKVELTPIGSYAFIQSNVCFYNCNISPSIEKNNYIYSYSNSTNEVYTSTAQAYNPLIESSKASFTNCRILPSFNYISNVDYSVESTGGKMFGIISQTCGLVISNSSVDVNACTFPSGVSLIKMKMVGYASAGDAALYDGPVFSSEQSISPFIIRQTENNMYYGFSVRLGAVVSVQNKDKQYAPVCINSMQTKAANTKKYPYQFSGGRDPYARTITYTRVPYQEMPIWSDAIRQNSTNVIDGAALPGFLTVGEHPNDGEVTYTPVPTD